MRYAIEKAKKSDYTPAGGNFLLAQSYARQWEAAKRAPYNAIGFTAFTRIDLGSYATRKEAQQAIDSHRSA